MLENFRLKVFRTVAEHLNFRKAGEMLYPSQPAVRAEAGVIDAKRLREVPFMLRECGSGIRHVVEQGLQKNGLRLGDLQVAMELDSTEAIVSCIEAGLGVGIVSKRVLSRRLRAGPWQQFNWQNTESQGNFYLFCLRFPACRPPY